MTTPETPDVSSNSLRQAAIDRLGKKRELQTHLLAFVTVNAMLNLVWWLTTPGGFYWPMFPLSIWGIGVVFHLWDFFVARNPSEEAISAEMKRLDHH